MNEEKKTEKAETTDAPKIRVLTEEEVLLLSAGAAKSSGGGGYACA